MLGTGEVLRDGRGQMNYYDGSHYEGFWRLNKR
jgi:hypothetical protein